MTIPNRFGYNVSLSAQQKREQNMGSGGSVNTNSTSSGSSSSNMIAPPPPPPSSIQQSYHGASSSGGNNSNYSSPHAHHHHPSHHAHHPQQQHHHATPPPPPSSITPYPQQQSSSSSSSSHHGMIAAGNVSGGVSPNTPGNSNESFAYNHHAHHSQAPQQQQHHMSSQQQQSPPLGYNTAAAAHHTNTNSYHHASYHASSNEASPMMNAHHASTTPGPPSVGVAAVGTYHPTNNSNNNMYSDNVHHHHNAHHPHMSSQQQALAPPPQQQQHAPSHHMQHHNAQQHQQQSVQQQSPMTPRSGSNSKSNGNRNNANGGGGGSSSSGGNNSNRKKKANKDQQATAAAITAHKNKLKEDMTHFLNRYDKIFSDVKSQSQNCHCARKRKWDEMASIKTEASTLATVSVDENGNAVTTTAASNTGATDDENKMRKDEEERLMLSDGQIVPFKKRRVQTTLGTEQRELSLTVDAEQVMNWMVQSIRNFFQYSPAVQQETQGSDEQKLMQIIVQFMQSHQDQFLTQITENENSKSNSSESNQSIDYSQLRDSVSHAACFPMLFSLAKQLVDQFIALYASNNENIALLSSANGEMFIDSTLPHVQQSQNNPALIDMTVDSILVTFVGKDSQSEKQEEVSIFVERFLGLQQQYREELHYINEGQASWLHRYSEVLNEQSKLRYVSPLERTLTLRKVREKFGNIISMLREKYMSKVFSLQENVLLRSKKRGNLPKHATNILKTWLFSNFLHPYPSETEKLELSQQTQLTLIQINNWFINARVRTWRPMLESMLQGEKAKATKNNPQMQHLHNLTPGQITAALNNNGQGPPPMQMPPPSNQRSMMQPPPMQGHMPMTQHMQPHMQAGFMPSGQPGYPSMRHEMDQGNPYMWSHQHEAEHPHPHPMMQGGMPGQFGFPAPHGGWHEPHHEDDHFPH